MKDGRYALRRITAVRHDMCMAGVLEALILRPKAVRSEIRRVGAVVANLEQGGVGLLPLTGPVRHALAKPDTDAQVVPGFYELTESVTSWARSLSEITPVAYVHLEFHGGTGFHAAIGWVGGAIAWGPRFTCNHPAEADEYYELTEDLAINGVLRWLGVHRGVAVDEFAAAGLARFRWTDEWAAAGT